MDENKVVGAIKEFKGDPEDAIGWAVSDGGADRAIGKILDLYQRLE